MSTEKLLKDKCGAVDKARELETPQQLENCSSEINCRIPISIQKMIVRVNDIGCLS